MKLARYGRHVVIDSNVDMFVDDVTLYSNGNSDRCLENVLN